MSVKRDNEIAESNCAGGEMSRAEQVLDQITQPNEAADTLVWTNRLINEHRE